jgi:hypothetical protein
MMSKRPQAEGLHHRFEFKLSLIGYQDCGEDYEGSDRADPDTCSSMFSSFARLSAGLGSTGLVTGSASGGNQ